MTVVHPFTWENAIQPEDVERLLRLGGGRMFCAMAALGASGLDAEQISALQGPDVQADAIPPCVWVDGRLQVLHPRTAAVIVGGRPRRRGYAFPKITGAPLEPKDIARMISSGMLELGIHARFKTLVQLGRDGQLFLPEGDTDA